MSKSNDDKVPGRCPSCHAQQLKRRSTTRKIYCYTCGDTDFTADEIERATAEGAFLNSRKKKKHRPKEYKGERAGPIVIPQFRWGGSRLG